MRRFWQNNSLSIVLFGIFFCALVGMSVVGWRSANNEALGHNQSTESYSTYVTSGDFVEGVFENWESEFLQMFALVILTIWLRQKGADDSKPIRGKTPQDTSSRLSIIGAGDWKKRRKAIGHTLYSHSLSLALISIFFCPSSSTPPVEPPPRTTKPPCTTTLNAIPLSPISLQPSSGMNLCRIGKANFWPSDLCCYCP